MKTVISKSEKETLNLAAEFAEGLGAGTVVLLTGDLGSGKSVFARGVIRAYGVKQAVTSPTFTLINRYDIPPSPAIKSTQTHAIPNKITVKPAKTNLSGKFPFGKNPREGFPNNSPLRKRGGGVADGVFDLCAIYHMDMYRLEDITEAYNIGIEEILDDKTSIKLIEWPERIAALLPKGCVAVNIKKVNDNTREIVLGKS